MINQCHLFLNAKILFQEQESLIPVTGTQVHIVHAMGTTEFELCF